MVVLYKQQLQQDRCEFSVANYRSYKKALTVAKKAKEEFEDKIGVKFKKNRFLKYISSK